PSNAQLLEYEHWLLMNVLRLDSVHVSNETIRAKRKYVVDCIEMEWTKLDNMKETEWYRQQKALTLDSQATTTTMKHWFAELICRPGVEEIMDKRRNMESSPERMEDIWDGEILRNFPGPNGEPFFAQEGRYAFSLCMDEFNPYHMKEAGKKVSVGAIYLVCLNLPPEMRYRFENVFLVGIVP
ncbi:hypothetical protein BD410DRAFT_694522, partial [Rickenella mellea]